MQKILVTLSSVIIIYTFNRVIKHMYNCSSAYTKQNRSKWNGDFFFALHTNSYSWSTRVFPFIAVLATFTHGTYIISYKSTIYGKKMRFKCVSRDFRASMKHERREQRHTSACYRKRMCFENRVFDILILMVVFFQLS